jgi:hypothetical protein
MQSTRDASALISGSVRNGVMGQIRRDSNLSLARKALNDLFNTARWRPIFGVERTCKSRTPLRTDDTNSGDSEGMHPFIPWVRFLLYDGRIRLLNL